MMIRQLKRAGLIACLTITGMTCMFAVTDNNKSTLAPLPVNREEFVSNFKIEGNKKEIKIIGEVGENASAKIYDSTGKLVGEFKLENKNENIIVLQKVSVGLHILEIQTEMGFSIQRFFM